MLRLTQTALTSITGLSARAIGYKLNSEPSKQIGRYKYYSLIDACPAVLGSKYAALAPALVKESVDDGESFVGNSDSTPSNLRFELWLNTNVTGGQHRLSQVRHAFGESLANTVASGAFYSDFELLRSLIASSSRITPFLITGDAETLPKNFDQFCTEFSLLHARGVGQYQRVRA